VVVVIATDLSVLAAETIQLSTAGVAHEVVELVVAGDMYMHCHLRLRSPPKLFTGEIVMMVVIRSCLHVLMAHRTDGH